MGSGSACTLCRGCGSCSIRYVLTPRRQRLAIFYTELYNRLLRPFVATDQPQAPPELRQALATIDHHDDDYIDRARLKPAT
jgi:hypothetical protein